MAKLTMFSTATQLWVEQSFAAPTAAQTQAWSAISQADDTLVVAPTGSGKTLAAFLWGIDQLMTTPRQPGQCQIIYVSPLKALAFDVERNLNAPLIGITHLAQQHSLPVRNLTVGVRTGDTTPQQRRALQANPPDILVTTPESLYLMLTSSAREMFTDVQAVIIDEIHALAGSKRGAHLALSLARLEHLSKVRPQRIGLSATVRPAERVAAFLSGTTATPTIVAPQIPKTITIEVISPVADLSDLAGTTAPRPDPGPIPQQGSDNPASVWPHITDHLVDLITSHTTTLVFTNSRRSAERLTAQINDCYADRIADGSVRQADSRSQYPAQNPGQSGTADGSPPVLARAHHGSMSRLQRTEIENNLKAGHLPAVVATSSLELGIDMGSVDLVIQVGAPPSVAATLQRVGRAGHQVGAASHGLFIPTHRGDLLTSALTSCLAQSGMIEASHELRHPLDVLAQHIVAITANSSWLLKDLLTLVRTAQPFADLSEEVFRGVLDMLAGRYPSDEFGDLRARLVWDRTTDEISGRPGALMLATTNAGTIPDRGLYGVYLAGEASAAGGKRVGELDEEMVFESRVGDTFMLGSASWRIEDITPDRVLVTPATGMPGRLPFWRGDSPARPAELGKAMGRLIAEVTASDQPLEVLASWGLDEWARKNTLEYLQEQQQATGVVPDSQRIVVEKFRDDLGDWRIIIHTPFGSAVHAPWALLLSQQFRAQHGIDVAAMHTDDGIVLRLPDTDSSWDPLDPLGEKGPGIGALATQDLFLEPTAIRSSLIEAITGSAHFAARFREAAARSLLLPRRRPGSRQPLWQQRQRAASLLSVAAKFPDFPIVLEVVRECLNDDYDIEALIDLMSQVQNRSLKVVEVTTTTPSPFAQTILFSYVGQFLYDGDAPLADRRAAALSLDPGLLAQLLGQTGAAIDDLISPEAIAQVEREIGLLHNIRSLESLFDVLARIGPVPSSDLVPAEVSDAGDPQNINPQSGDLRVGSDSRPDITPSDIEMWLQELETSRRIGRAHIGGRQMWFAIEDTGRLRDGLGMVPPPGVPTEFLQETPDALTQVLARYARTHGPFRLQDVAQFYGVGVSALQSPAQALIDRGVLVRGQLTQHTSEPVSGAQAIQYCDADVLARIRRRSIALLRREVEPVPAEQYVALATRWHHIGRLRGLDGVLETIETLAGAPVAASALESLILPARVKDYTPAMLDELLALGEVMWVGHGQVGTADGWISLHTRETAELLAPAISQPLSAQSQRLHELIGPGATFPQLLSQGLSAEEIVAQLWELIWDGAITSNSFVAMRAYLGSKARGGRTAPAQNRPRSLRRSMVLSTARIAVPPTAQGLWLPTPQRADDSARLTASVLSLLDRHGLVTRGCTPDDLQGGFGTVYRAMSAAESDGILRRGYFIEGLGGAQFALPEAVDQLRAVNLDKQGHGVFDATDPAQPFGLALPWPQTPASTSKVRSHLPGRKVGGRVVLVAGKLVLYLERGGKTLLRFTDDPQLISTACEYLAAAVLGGYLGTVTITRTDGASAWNSELADALVAAGFVASPRGYMLRPQVDSTTFSPLAPTSATYPWMRYARG